jgi:ABC-type multidrug transport system ATPase subunit
LNGYQNNIIISVESYFEQTVNNTKIRIRMTIKYAADLRLAGKMDDKGRKQRQIDVITLMGIEHIADVIIGDTRRKGISGGERKRVCVAIELLTAPKLIFLDEVS